MNTEQQLDQAISQLPREMMPARDLWAAIEPQLQDRAQVPGRRLRVHNMQRWAAVLALALVGVVWWGQMDLPQPGQVNPDAVVAGSGADNNSDNSADNNIQQLPADAWIAASFEQIKAQQLSEMDYISPAVGDWQYQLAVWDQAISQVRGALEYYPDEPFLLGQMQGLYQQQIDYLHTISAVDTSYVWMGE